MLSAGAFAYLFAVTNRSSLGVASLIATEKFHVSAAALSTMAVSQLAIYSLMQIPVGILLDRFGARRLMIYGTIAIGAGQFLVALATDLSAAVVGRGLVGLGDAFIFIPLVRLVNGWFVGSAATRYQQLVTNVGQLGQAVSAIPFAALLHWQGWQVSFMTLASITLLVVMLLIIFVHNDREGTTAITRPQNLKTVAKYLVENIKHPGVRMAFWVHFSLQSAPSVFLLLWGYPFLVKAQGLAPETASLMLSSFVVIGFFAGPFISGYCAKYPHRRSNLVFTALTSVFVSWLIVIATPGKSTFAMLMILCVALSISGPTSMVAFDFIRSFVPKSKMGTASGFANVGGFSATFIMMFLAGIILDAVQAANHSDSAPLYSIEGFRWAMTIQLAALVLGCTMIVIERAKARAKLEREEGINLKPLRVVLKEKIKAKRR